MATAAGMEKATAKDINYSQYIEQKKTAPKGGLFLF
jgi:hypothetical protein